MFFRSHVEKKVSFSDRMNAARSAGFTVQLFGTDQAKISKNGVAALVVEIPGGTVKVTESAGMIVGDEIARLVDGGYQKFIQTPSGKRRAALASDLTSIHKFQADLGEALCLPGTYNMALGTVSNQYIYDRVEERDSAHKKEPWEIATSLPEKA